MLGFRQIDELTIGECFEALVGNQSNAYSAQSVEIVSKFRELWGNMSFVDQFRFLEHYKSYEENDLYIEIKELFCQRTEEIRKKEQADYEFCEQIEDYSDFINLYSSMLPAYQPLFLEQAKQREGQLKEKLEREKREREKREREERHKRIKLSLFITLAFILVSGLIVIFIGYQPVGDFKLCCDEEFVFGKEGGEKAEMVLSNTTDIVVKSPKDNWVEKCVFDKEDNTIIIGTILNKEGELNTKAILFAYPSFFGKRISLGKKVLTINIKQESGLASFIEVDQQLNFSKFGDAKCVNVKTDGVSLSIKPDKDCEEWLSCTIKEDKQNGKYYHNALCEIVVALNPNSKRTGKILVESGGIKKEVLIMQESGLASFITVNPWVINFEVEGLGKGQYIKVDFSTDGAICEVSNVPNWVMVEKTVTRNENGFTGSLKVIPRENEEGAREGFVYISSSNGLEKRITITQNGWKTYRKQVVAVQFLYDNGWKQTKTNGRYGQTYDEIVKHGPDVIDNLIIVKRRKGGVVEYGVSWRARYYPLSESPIRGYKYCFYYNDSMYCFNM